MTEAMFYHILSMDATELLLFALLIMPDCNDPEMMEAYKLALYLS